MNEFDKYHNDFCSNLNLKKGIYLFGAGKVGGELSKIFKSLCNVKGFIDNDSNKLHKTYNGLHIISLEEIKKEKIFIVVTISIDKYYEIKQQLNDIGYIENRDYVHWEKFLKMMFPVALNYQEGKNYVGLVQISVTERCTLCCVKCAHACNYVSISEEDLAIDIVKESADAFFSFCDYVHTFVLIGGEPLLYKQLADAIDYIGENYRDRIYNFQISTNGTIMPSDSIIEKSKKWDVHYLISNYSVQIPKLKKQYELLIDKFDFHKVDYAIFPEDTEWTDYGFQNVERGNDPQKLIDVFDSCHTECHEIRGKRFYYCVMARSVNDNMKRNVGADDYLDLGNLDPAMQSDKRIFLEYTLGYSDKGYLDMCRFCNGAERENYIIPAAVQGKRIN